MRIIEIQPLDNGAHRNQTGNFTTIPTGWAEIPADVAIPETFPFVDLVVEGRKVVSMTAGVVPEVEPDNTAKIAELKAKLESTDYQIIKCSEAQLAGEEMPYDIQALHAERQAIRDEINALEGSDA